MTLPTSSVCLDVQGAQSKHHYDRGIARYISEHARALYRTQREMLNSVLFNPALPLTGNMSWLLGSGLMSWGTEDPRIKRAQREAPAIYHVMSPFEHQPLNDMWPSWARSSAVRTVVTLYDVIPFVFADHYLRDPAARASYRTRAMLVQSADRVLAISTTTAEDATRYLGIRPDRISVIDAGASDKFAAMYSSPQAAWDALERERSDIRPGFILYVAGFEFRKNLERVVAAYGRLTPALQAKHQLVIACRMSPAEIERVQGWTSAAGIEPGRVVVTGYVADSLLGALYHACFVFLFASIYEGSGLPILEAMSCDAAVLASNASTGPEILGDTLATFDPYDPDSIAATIAQTIASPETIEALKDRSRARVTEYTWQAVAEKSIEAYEHALKQRGRGAPNRRRARLALVTPWPPEQSGIADYNMRLVEELADYADVDVIVEHSPLEYAPTKHARVKLLSADSFERLAHLRQHDRVAYCMGNSAYHRYVYELLHKRPGVVIAHDVRFTGFYRWLAEQECPKDPLSRTAGRLFYMYEERLPREIIEGGLPTWEEQASLGIYMTRGIQRSAEKMFVHSRYAREALLMDRGPLDREVPIELLPFAMPETLARDSWTIDDPATIVSVGVVSELKGLATLIEAVSLVGEHHPETRLVLAGPAPPAELRRWREFARRIAPGMAIEVTGHLAPERYRDLLHEADLAVQLRAVSHGEASAAVADCLAAGIPTIVSDDGWAAELPAASVARVPPGATPRLLAELLERLLHDHAARAALGRTSLEYAKSHSFAHAAEAYASTLDLIAA